MPWHFVGRLGNTEFVLKKFFANTVQFAKLIVKIQCYYGSNHIKGAYTQRAISKILSVGYSQVGR